MVKRDEILAQMAKLSADIQKKEDDWLEALALLAANERAQIIPYADEFLGTSKRPVFCLPRTMFERMQAVVTERRGAPTQRPSYSLDRSGS